MNAVGWLGSAISQGVGVVSGPFHPFGGAIDIIVVEQSDGSFKSSPWYVRFGKFQGVLKTKEKVVNISVNGVEADFCMYLNHRGEAYFLKEVEVQEGDPVPCPSSSGDETDGKQQKDKMVLKSKSLDFGVSKLESVGQIDLNNGKIVSTTGSNGRSRILGFVFGRKSIKERDLQVEGGPGVERTSSLDRAEFAADLLEVKWSTNLDIDNMERDSGLRLSNSGMSNGGPEGHIQIESEKTPLRSLVVENDEYNLVDTGLQEIASAHSEQTGDSFQSTSDNLDGLIEDVCLEMLCSSTQEHTATTSVMIENVNEDICLISGKSDEYSIGNDDLSDEILNGCTSKNADPYSQMACLNVVKVSPSKQFGGKKALEEKDVSPGSRIPKESIIERDRVHSLYYCDESSERSVLGFNGSREQLHGTVSVSTISSEELPFLAESVHASRDLQEESAVSEGLNKHTGLEAAVTDPNNHFQPTNSSNLVLEDSDNASHQVVLQSSQMVDIEPISASAEQVKPQSISPVSSSYSCDLVQDGSITWDEKDDNQPSRATSDFIQDEVINDQILDNSEEQFLFSDLDESKLSSACCAGSQSIDYGDDKRYPISSPRGTKENNESINSNQEFFISSENSRPEKQSCDFQSSTVMLEMTSHPVNIPVSCKPTNEDVFRHVKSLPNISVHIEDLGAKNICHPYSKSVDSDSKSKWVLIGENGPYFKNNAADCSYNLETGKANNEDTQNLVEQRNIFSRHAVEVSLCKHMLYEGMGADAASRAFDSQKLDIDNYSNLGTEIVKDDRLVVRIDGRYFPWDAAASHVLGLISFGSDHIFEPRGSIAIEQADNCPEGDPSKPAPGSWRLWPFSFKRSRSRKAVQPDLSGARIYANENASESTVGTDAEKEVYKHKVVKKTIRTKTPTSEQLASLKLKEGMNLVTFTFSTSVLGKQQVDARIYLWKWNTRIVISDVDGTITKSDVLGQFMPLVGIDWSQTGVTNLFSAIKENGYQLLFLSARAISQAYYTRQFLFNLKQDGKALPDGPVCISPDGLFPSLFREVIRRAPHEFKIACLEDIKALFPSECNPFYAGFGNRDTDEISYLKVGIPRGKIFIINPKGEVAVNRCVDTKSYTSLHALVNGMFPPMSSSEQEDYNEWNYWKLPAPVIDI